MDPDESGWILFGMDVFWWIWMDPDGSGLIPRMKITSQIRFGPKLTRGWAVGGLQRFGNVPKFYHFSYLLPPLIKTESIDLIFFQLVGRHIYNFFTKIIGPTFFLFIHSSKFNWLQGGQKQLKYLQWTVPSGLVRISYLKNNWLNPDVAFFWEFYFATPKDEALTWALVAQVYNITENTDNSLDQ